MHIILIGMRAAGKTYFGKIFSKKFKLNLIDTDELIQKNEKCSIQAMVEKHGWPYFREKEYETIQNLSAYQPSIVATGAGLPVAEKNQKILKNYGKVIWIKTPPQVMIDYLKKTTTDHRPSLTGKSIVDEFLEVYDKRKIIYQKLADFVFDTSKNIENQIDLIKP